MNRLPIGIENYLDAIEAYFVDKTLFIKEAIDYFSYRTVLLTRPRRFGKSLTLSMLEYYFTNKGNYRYAFEGRKILSQGPEYTRHLNQYPVIHLNMKNVTGENYDDLLFETKKAIASLFEGFAIVLDSDKLSPRMKEEFEAFLHLKHQEDKPYTGALSFLIDALYAYYGKRVIVLIDEYDTPLNEAYQKGFFDEAVGFFSSFYSSSLKGVDKLLMGVLTGVLEISKESVFSELNNVDVYSIADEELSTYFGFTTSEVKELFAFFGVDTPVEEAIANYGGYGGGKEKVCNPWSILNYVNRRRFLPYWLNTGSNYYINSLLTKNPNNLDRLLLIVNDKARPFHFERAISFRDLESGGDYLLSLLVHAGYLSAYFSNEDSAYYLSVPNIETRSVIEKEIISRNNAAPMPLKEANLLREAFLAGDKNGIEEAFTRIFSSFSYFDFNSEKDYQNAITGILAILFDEYIVKSEVNTPKGRCDILVSPKNEKGTGIVVEIKRYKGRESQAKALEKAKVAFNQIKMHRYSDELKMRECQNVFLYAFIVFDNGFRAFSEEI